MRNNERRVQEIADRLEALSLESASLTRELRRLTRSTQWTADGGERNREETRSANNNRPLQVGDRVVITNRYRGRRGTEGTVVRVTSTQVTLRDSSGDEHTRKQTNVQRV